MGSGAQVLNTPFFRGNKCLRTCRLFRTTALSIIVRSRNLVFDITVLLYEESRFVHPVEKSLDSSLVGGVDITPPFRTRIQDAVDGTVVALATVFNSWSGNPCALSRRRAYMQMERAPALSKVSTWADTERSLVIVTPRIRSEQTRYIAKGDGCSSHLKKFRNFSWKKQFLPRELPNC